VRKSTGSIALLGGGEWTEPCRALDSHLLHLADCDEVLIVPTAAAFEHPDRVVEHAVAWFAGLGATATGMPVLNRRDAEADEHVAAMRVAKFVYLADGSPLHLRSVLKASPLFDALLYAHGRGAVIAEPPSLRAWGMYEMRLHDPDGNMLRVSSYPTGR